MPLTLTMQLIPGWELKHSVLFENQFDFPASYNAANSRMGIETELVPVFSMRFFPSYNAANSRMGIETLVLLFASTDI